MALLAKKTTKLPPVLPISCLFGAAFWAKQEGASRVGAAAATGAPRARTYFTRMSSYSWVPRPIFSACSMQLCQCVSGCVT